MPIWNQNGLSIAGHPMNGNGALLPDGNSQAASFAGKINHVNNYTPDANSKIIIKTLSNTINDKKNGRGIFKEPKGNVDYSSKVDCLSQPWARQTLNKSMLAVGGWKERGTSEHNKHCEEYSELTTCYKGVSSSNENEVTLHNIPCENGIDKKIRDAAGPIRFLSKGETLSKEEMQNLEKFKNVQRGPVDTKKTVCFEAEEFGGFGCFKGHEAFGDTIDMCETYLTRYQCDDSGNMHPDTSMSFNRYYSIYKKPATQGDQTAKSNTNDIETYNKISGLKEAQTNAELLLKDYVFPHFEKERNTIEEDVSTKEIHGDDRGWLSQVLYKSKLAGRGPHMIGYAVKSADDGYIHKTNSCYKGASSKNGMDKLILDEIPCKESIRTKIRQSSRAVQDERYAQQLRGMIGHLNGRIKKLKSAGNRWEAKPLRKIRKNLADQLNAIKYHLKTAEIQERVNRFKYVSVDDTSFTHSLKDPNAFQDASLGVLTDDEKVCFEMLDSEGLPCVDDNSLPHKNNLKKCHTEIVRYQCDENDNMKPDANMDFHGYHSSYKKAAGPINAWRMFGQNLANGDNEIYKKQLEPSPDVSTAKTRLVDNIIPFHRGKGGPSSEESES